MPFGAGSLPRGLVPLGIGERGGSQGCNQQDGDQGRRHAGTADHPRCRIGAGLLYFRLQPQFTLGQRGCGLPPGGIHLARCVDIGVGVSTQAFGPGRRQFRCLGQRTAGWQQEVGIALFQQPAMGSRFHPAPGAQRLPVGGDGLCGAWPAGEQRVMRDPDACGVAQRAGYQQAGGDERVHQPPRIRIGCRQFPRRGAASDDAVIGHVHQGAQHHRECRRRFGIERRQRRLRPAFDDAR